MFNKARPWFVLAGVVAVAACRPGPPPPPASAPAPAPVPVPDPSPGLSLPARLAREASTRPAGAPRAEVVLEALARGGLTLTGRRQVLGRTIGAAYCESAVTPRGVALAVCEFADDEQARRGQDHSHRSFDRLIPGRLLVRNRHTLLTVAAAPADPAAAAEARAAATLFAAL